MQPTVAPHALTRPPAPGRTNEPTPGESKKKPVKRSNSFSRRKNKGKGDEPGGAEADGYSGDADALQKPAFKLEEQKDPLREALQQERASCLKVLVSLAAPVKDLDLLALCTSPARPPNPSGGRPCERRGRSSAPRALTACLRVVVAVAT